MERNPEFDALLSEALQEQQSILAKLNKELEQLPVLLEKRKRLVSLIARMRIVLKLPPLFAPCIVVERRKSPQAENATEAKPKPE